MAYAHQIDQIKIFGTAGTEVVFGSGAAIKGRHIFTQNSILRKVSVYLLASSTTAKPVITLRRAAAKATTTATGTAISGGTITVPATLAKGTVVMRTKLNTAFNVGDHLVVHVSTAATKALTTRVTAFVEPDWEADPQTTAVHPNNAGVNTVTA